ncbi:unnamed protein product [Echinostoma caproni]|uniref:G domain-containing protein n=1 Tax=Echinostoma caproni TaxID=27848 RepID=A0A183AD61_9TREM|nr:unnamed protein product [Echinostoma caproni]
MQEKQDQVSADFAQVIATKAEELGEIEQKLNEMLSRTECEMQKQTADQMEIENIQKSFEKLYESIEEVEVIPEMNRRLRDERDEALHEHRLKDLITQGSLQDEVNEVFGRETESAQCQAVNGVVVSDKVLTGNKVECRFVVSVPNLEVHCSSFEPEQSRGDSLLQSMKEEVFSEDYEFDDTWLDEEHRANILTVKDETVKQPSNQFSHSVNVGEHISKVHDDSDGVMYMDMTINQGKHSIRRDETSNMFTFKILLLSQNGSGKTAILDKAFCSVTYPAVQKSSPINLCSTTYAINQIDVVFNIWEFPVENHKIDEDM